jgi:serpin B
MEWRFRKSDMQIFRKVCLSFICLAVAACAAGSAAKQDAALSAPARQSVSAQPADLTHGLGYFTARFYRALSAKADQNENLFISPLSLSQGIGLAWLGARGRTESEMRLLLGWPEGSEPALLTAFHNERLLSTGDPKVEMRIANALWLADGLPIREDYLKSARQAYNARPQTLEFTRAPAAAADRINSWVLDATRGRIPKLVSAEQFNSSTAAVLTNAVHFKGDWQAPFVDGADGNFTLANGVKKPIYLMERVAPMQYRATNEGQAVALPYGEEGRFVMEVFLPRSASIMTRWERQLHGQSFFGGEQGSDGRFDLSAEKETTILLRLPRFEARFNEAVHAALADAGMPCAFLQGVAEFPGIAPLPMKIDRVAHATFLRVDEVGTEAAAATASDIVVVGGRIPHPSLPRMIVDRPFLMTLRDRASGALLFFGRISDPTAAAPAN